MKFIKTIILVSIMITSLHSKAQTGYQLGTYGLYYLDKVSPTVSLFYTQELGHKFTLINYFYVDQKWAQGIFGLNYQLTNWLSLGCMVGLQINEKSAFRIAPVFWLKKNKFSLFGIFEKGGDRDRYKLLLYYRFNKNLRAGLYGIKLMDIYAFGPRAEFRLAKTPFYIWGTPLFVPTNGEFAAMLGLYYRFKTKKEE